MRCKGLLKEKNSSSRNKGKLCNANIDDHAIFCPVCGTPTPALNNELSAKKVFKLVYADTRERVKKFTSLGLLLMILSLTLLFLVFFVTDNMYLINNMIILFILPFLLIPLGFSWSKKTTDLSLQNYFKHLIIYPQLWVFTLINILYYFLLKVVCTGFLLNIATDPILHLVRLTLSIYWLAIILPVPFLIVNKRLTPFKAIYISYKAGAETRWQHFFLICLVLLMNIAAIIPLGIGLIFTLPLSYKIMHQYYRNMDEFQLFDL